MSLNETPSSMRTRISFFGKRNAGKSSLVNAITGQALSVVSDVAGTTTDPVNKSMEILPLGPVIITDTAGFDDEGSLGELRIKKTMETLNKTDIAVLVTDINNGGIDADEKNMISQFNKNNIPYIVVYNKCDMIDGHRDNTATEFYVSAKNGYNIDELKNRLASLKPQQNSLKMIGDFIDKGDIVVFVTPIDEAAPKGRLILPQQQAIRDTLDSGAISIVVQPEELEETLKKLTVYPKLVVTDSQVFAQVSKIVPENIPLTSFSILMARTKSLLKNAVYGASMLNALKDGDKILISEGCTHHRQCNDIGTVKLPKLILNYTKKNIEFEFASGTAFPEDIGKYALIIHCGGCMISEKEMLYRIKKSTDSNVPITNYGTAIAQMNGILKRSLEIMPELLKLLD